MVMSPHDVRIHINREKYHSPDPTTGEALYTLGNVPKHQELFREVSGDDEDVLIPRDSTVVHLTEDEHFYSQKAVTLIVNAKKHPWEETRIDFDQAVKLAYPTPPPGQNILYTIMYRHGPKVNPKGSLLEGQSVRVKNEMIFDVTATDRS
jgi:hypothetical protein